MTKLGTDLRAWARIGAEKRLVEIAEEAASIHRAFPELRNRHKASTASVGRRSNAGDDAAASATPARRRRRMSAAGRAKLRASLKKRWAEAKKAGKKRLS